MTATLREMRRAPVRIAVSIAAVALAIAAIGVFAIALAVGIVSRGGRKKSRRRRVRRDPNAIYQLVPREDRHKWKRRRHPYDIFSDGKF